MPGLNYGNAGAYFSPTTTYAGSWPMEQALQQYLNEINGPQAGGQAHLAASAASEPVAQQYQASAGMGPTAQGGPQQAFNNNAFANLVGGQRGARETGRQVGSQVKLNAEQGVANVGNAYAGDITQNISAQTQLEQAKAAQSALEQQQIMGLTTSAASILGGIPSSPFGGAAGGASASGAQAGSGGFTPATPGSFSPGSLPPWLDPNQVAAYGPEMGTPGASTNTANNWLQNAWGSYVGY